MNDKFQQLYSYLTSNGMTNLSADAFKEKYSETSNFDNLYNYLKIEGLTNLSNNDFYNTYFLEGVTDEQDQAKEVTKQQVTKKEEKPQSPEELKMVKDLYNSWGKSDDIKLAESTPIKSPTGEPMFSEDDFKVDVKKGIEEEKKFEERKDQIKDTNYEKYANKDDWYNLDLEEDGVSYANVITELGLEKDLEKALSLKYKSGDGILDYYSEKFARWFGGSDGDVEISGQFGDNYTDQEIINNLIKNKLDEPEYAQIREELFNQKSINNYNNFVSNSGMSDNEIEDDIIENVAKPDLLLDYPNFNFKEADTYLDKIASASTDKEYNKYQKEYIDYLDKIVRLDIDKGLIVPDLSDGAILYNPQTNTLVRRKELSKSEQEDAMTLNDYVSYEQAVGNIPTDKQRLKELLIQKTFQILTAGKEIIKNEDYIANQQGFFRQLAESSPDEEYTPENAIKPNEFKKIREMVETGKIVPGLDNIEGLDNINSVAKYNSLLNDYKVLSQALLMNYDPTTLDKESFGKGFASGASMSFAGIDILTDDEKANIMLDELEVNFPEVYKQIPEDEKKKIKEQTWLYGAGEMLPPFLKIATEFTLTRKIAGSTLNQINRMLLGGPKYWKNRVAIESVSNQVANRYLFGTGSFRKYVPAITNEMLVIEGRNVIANTYGDEAMSPAWAIGGVGAGQFFDDFGRAILSSKNKTFWNIYGKFTNAGSKFKIPQKTIGEGLKQNVFRPIVGTTTMKVGTAGELGLEFASGEISAKEFWDQILVVDENGQSHFWKDFTQTAASIWAMRGLAPFKVFRETVSNIKTDINRIKRRNVKLKEENAKKLGIDLKEYSDEKLELKEEFIDKAIKKLTKNKEIYNQDQFDSLSDAFKALGLKANKIPEVFDVNFLEGYYNDRFLGKNIKNKDQILRAKNILKEFLSKTSASDFKVKMDRSTEVYNAKDFLRFDISMSDFETMMENSVDFGYEKKIEQVTRLQARMNKGLRLDEMDIETLGSTGFSETFIELLGIEKGMSKRDASMFAKSKTGLARTLVFESDIADLKPGTPARKQYLEDRVKTIELELEKARWQEEVKNKGLSDVVIEKVNKDLDKKINLLKEKTKDIVENQENLDKLTFETDLEFARKSAKRLLDKEVVELNEAELKKIKKDSGLTDREIQKYSSSDGFYNPKNKTIYINRNQALRSREKKNWKKTRVGSHELLHAVLDNVFTNEKGIVTPEGRALIDAFKKTLSPRELKYIDNQLDDFYRKPGKEKIEFDKRNYEEYLNIFVDHVMNGNIKRDKEIEKVLNDKSSEFNFETGEGLTNFIYSFIKSSKEGKLRQEILDLVGKKQTDKYTEEKAKKQEEAKPEETEVEEVKTEKKKVSKEEKVEEDERIEKYKKATELVEEGKIKKTELKVTTRNIKEGIKDSEDRTIYVTGKTGKYKLKRKGKNTIDVLGEFNTLKGAVEKTKRILGVTDKEIKQSSFYDTKKPLEGTRVKNQDKIERDMKGVDFAKRFNKSLKKLQEAKGTNVDDVKNMLFELYRGDQITALGETFSKKDLTRLAIQEIKEFAQKEGYFKVTKKPDTEIKKSLSTKQVEVVFPKELEAQEIKYAINSFTEQSADAFLNIRFSKSARESYVKMLSESPKRAELYKGLSESKKKLAVEKQVDEVYKFVDKEVEPTKKSKITKLAFNFLSKSNIIFPDNNYKLIYAEKIAEKKKVDPFSFESLDAILALDPAQFEKLSYNPDNEPGFKNKKELENGIIIYDVEPTKEGQLAIRKAADVSFGKNFNGWCITERFPREMGIEDYWRRKDVIWERESPITQSREEDLKVSEKDLNVLKRKLKKDYPGAKITLFTRLKESSFERGFTKDDRLRYKIEYDKKKPHPKTGKTFEEVGEDFVEEELTPNSFEMFERYIGIIDGEVIQVIGGKKTLGQNGKVAFHRSSPKATPKLVSFRSLAMDETSASSLFNWWDKNDNCYTQGIPFIIPSKTINKKGFKDLSIINEETGKIKEVLKTFKGVKKNGKYIELSKDGAEVENMIYEKSQRKTGMFSDETFNDGEVRESSVVFLKDFVEKSKATKTEALGGEESYITKETINENTSDIFDNSEQFLSIKNSIDKSTLEKKISKERIPKLEILVKEKIVEEIKEKDLDFYETAQGVVSVGGDIISRTVLKGVDANNLNNVSFEYAVKSKSRKSDRQFNLGEVVYRKGIDQRSYLTKYDLEKNKIINSVDKKVRSFSDEKLVEEAVKVTKDIKENLKSKGIVYDTPAIFDSELINNVIKAVNYFKPYSSIVTKDGKYDTRGIPFDKVERELIIRPLKVLKVYELSELLDVNDFNERIYLNEDSIKFSRSTPRERRKEYDKRNRDNKRISDLNEDIVYEIYKEYESLTGVEEIDRVINGTIENLKSELFLNNIGIIKKETDKAYKKGFNVPADRRMPYEDYESGFRAHFAGMIRTYFAETLQGKFRDVPFGAYVAQRLGKRQGQILKEWQQGQLTGVIEDASTKRDLSIAERETILSKEERDFSLRKRLGLDDDFKSKVFNKVRRTLGSKMPRIDSPEFVSKLKRDFEDDLTNTIRTEVFGLRVAEDGKIYFDDAKFNDFIRENHVALYEKLPLSVVSKLRNKRTGESLVKEVIDPKTGEQKRYTPEESRLLGIKDINAGNPVFRKLTRNELELDETFIQYYINPKTRKNERALGLAKILAKEIAFDAVMELVNTKDVFDRIRDVYDIQGIELPEGAEQLIAKQIDRNPNLRFSLSDGSLSVVDPNTKFTLSSKRDLKWNLKKEKFGMEEDQAIFYVKGKKYSIKLSYDPDMTSMFDSMYPGAAKGKVHDASFAILKMINGKEVAFTDITGDGDAFEVMGIVVNGLRDYANKNNVKAFTFTALEKSRASLYRRLNNAVGKELGWEPFAQPFFVGGDGLQFILANKKPKDHYIEDYYDSQLKFSKSVDLSKTLNDIIEDKTGIPSEKEFDQIAKGLGAKKGKFKIFLPYSAEDFLGLIYPLLSKGKLGEAQLEFFDATLLKPFARAMNDVSMDRIRLSQQFKTMKSELKDVPKNLNKEVLPGLTFENAVRIYAWEKQGIEVEGISEDTIAEVWEVMQENPELQVFADQLIDMNGVDGYSYPGKDWLSGSIAGDIYESLNTNKRKRYLKEWQDNVDRMFTASNMLKLEAAYGPKYVESLEDVLHRMKTGTNRTQGDRFSNRALDWLNGSIGVTMFFNTRSALLQTISSVNYINWTDNNPLQAGKAFANQSQYWKDFLYLWKSDFLKDRRSGLKINVSESELADAAKKGGIKGVTNLVLKSGFSLTKGGDSFAISLGGASFYRNRIKTYEKKGMSTKEAEKKAFIDFQESTNESQQSARPDKISKQQSSTLGRFILAFANTPLQYNRLMKRAFQDIANGRGDLKSNISKIIYYGFVQNVIFNALQSALFAVSFDDDIDEKEQARVTKVANGMLDSILRGMGYYGAAISTAKNFSTKLYKEIQKEKGRTNYGKMIVTELAGFSPPVQGKIRRFISAGNALDYNMKEIKEKGLDFNLDNPLYKSVADFSSGLFNIPLDRGLKLAKQGKYFRDAVLADTKIGDALGIVGNDLSNMEKVALSLGWSEWDLDIDLEKGSSKKSGPMKGKTFKSKKF